MRQTVLPSLIDGKSAPTRSESFARRLFRRSSVRRGAPGCVLAFPSPPNQVDRRVTRRRDTRSR